MKKRKILNKIGITWGQISYMMAGNLFFALALDLFFIGNNIAAGGLAGLGTVINYYFQLPVGLTIFLLNIPIGIWGIKAKGLKYIAISVANIGIFSLIVDGLSFLPTVTDDKLVAVVCGGILYGISASFAARANISSGGTDLLAKLIITKRKSMTLGQLYMILDGTVVTIATVAYGNIEYGIYAILAIGVGSVVTDKLNSGFNKASMFYIFADKNIEDICNGVIYELNRGATLFDGIGVYTQEQKKILFVVVSPGQEPILEKIVHRYDPGAFMVRCFASEIIGQGFRRLDLTSTIKEEHTERKIEHLKSLEEGVGRITGETLE